MNDAISFKSEAELNSYLEQFLGQLQLPSEDVMSQVITSCFSMIEQYLPTQNSPANNLSLKQVALLYIYKQQTIDRSNATAIALQYGHSSGASLCNKYNALIKRQNRVYVAERQANYMIKDMEAIKPLLDKEALAWAEREEELIKSSL